MGRGTDPNNLTDRGLLRLPPLQQDSDLVGLAGSVEGEDNLITDLVTFQQIDEDREAVHGFIVHGEDDVAQGKATAPFRLGTPQTRPFRRRTWLHLQHQNPGEAELAQHAVADGVVRLEGLHQAEHDGRATGGAAVDKAAGAAPQVDAERLAVVRERLASGYYETQSVTEAVAQRLLELLGLAPRDVASAPRGGDGE